MASNFWLSSHCNYWLVDRDTLRRARDLDRKYATDRQLACIGIWCANVLHKLTRRLQLRQVVSSTATTFLRRFYLKNSYCETDPALVIAGCVYLAAKIEECPVHVKSVVTEARAVFQEFHIKLPSDNSTLAEMEFYLLEDLDFHLVVFHPYRTLVSLCGKETNAPQEDLGTAKGGGDAELGEAAEGQYLDIDDQGLQLAWFVINDTYRSDLPLLHPPHLIAVAALYLALVLYPPARAKLAPALSAANTPTPAAAPPAKHHATRSTPVPTPTPADATLDFLAKLNVNLAIVAEIAAEMVALYEVWDAFENAPEFLRAGKPPSAPPAKTVDLEVAELLVRMRTERERDLAHPPAGSVSGAGEAAGEILAAEPPPTPVNKGKKAVDRRVRSVAGRG